MLCCVCESLRFSINLEEFEGEVETAIVRKETMLKCCGTL